MGNISFIFLLCLCHVTVAILYFKIYLCCSWSYCQQLVWDLTEERFPLSSLAILWYFLPLPLEVWQMSCSYRSCLLYVRQLLFKVVLSATTVWDLTEEGFMSWFVILSRITVWCLTEERVMSFLFVIFRQLLLEWFMLWLIVVLIATT